MRKLERFRISDKPYAIDLSTVEGEQKERDGLYYFRGSCKAVWFRRQARVTRACIGTLRLSSHYLREEMNTSSARDILRCDLDGRWGGECEGRWDGTRYWGAQEPEVMEKHLAVLRPMLLMYPDAPQGYEGWWSFQ